MTTRKRSAKSKVEDTGERMIPDFHRSKLLYGEHIVRYLAAQPFVEGKKVLDIASGSGYGTAVLGETAKSAVGVDVDKTAVEYAQAKFGNNNVSYVHGSGLNIPMDDESFDTLITFETIEHIEEYRVFLKEIRRVLKKDGVLVLSTPNDVEFPEGNHFHVHEFVEKELVALLKKDYRYVQMYYQSNWLYTLLSDEKTMGSEWTDAPKTLKTAHVSPEKSIYFYVICSNQPIKKAIEPIGSISEHYSARVLEENEKSIRAFIEEQGQLIAEQATSIDSLSLELRDLRGKINKLTSNPIGRLIKPFAKKIVGRKQKKG